MSLLPITLGLLAACADGPPPAAVSDKPAASTAPAPTAPPAASAGPTPSELLLANPPDNIARQGADDPRLGAWTVTTHTLDANDCPFEPPPYGEGSCRMGCGALAIEGIEPGFFRATLPVTGYAGVCVLLDEGAAWRCAQDRVDDRTEAWSLEGRFPSDGETTATWSVRFGCQGSTCGDGREAGEQNRGACSMRGTFHATRDGAG